jgi:membrane-associated PAP2 superfamily phosphatase
MKHLFIIFLSVLIFTECKGQQLDSAGYHLTRAGRDFNVGLASSIVGSTALFVAFNESSVNNAKISPLAAIGGGLIIFGIAKQLTASGHLRTAGKYLRTGKVSFHYQGNSIGLVCRL